MNPANSKSTATMSNHVLIIEAFYGGSHKQLVDLLVRDIDGCVKVTLPAKKWHWRARTAALYFSQHIPVSDSYRVLFCSSVLNLAELVALRPDLAKLRKVIYFHENQLEYPVQNQKQRDFQYGYNQILSCLVADEIYFNSSYNMQSFLTRIDPHLNSMPDYRPKGVTDKIRPKCKVLYFPIDFSQLRECSRKIEMGKSCDENVIKSRECETTRDVSSSASEHVNSEAMVMKLESEYATKDETVKATNDVFSASSHHGNSCEAVMEEKTSLKQATTIQSGGDDIQINKSCDNTSDILSTEPPNSKPEITDTTSCVHDYDRNDSSIAKKQCVEDLSAINVRGFNESCTTKDTLNAPLHIVWPHRWEHDKAPELFFETMLKLKEEGVPFVVSVLGETYTDVPAIFAEANAQLSGHIKQWGYLPSKAEYLRTLAGADVVVSTAKHEFFGVAMIEAAYLGCYPLCPNRLAYPEIFPRECLYNTENQLLKQLRKFCKSPRHLRMISRNFELERFDWQTIQSKFRGILSAESNGSLH